MRCCCSFGTFAMIGDALLLLLVGFCWGGTNPLLRRGAEGIQRQKASSLPRQLAADVLFLARRWDYVIPLVLNQAGSLVFLAALSRMDVSLVVPAANALAVVFAAVVGHALGEGSVFGGRSFCGMLLITAGVACCLFSKA
eukprot:m.93811 g.93811  ORF g.93811 m.93811 type:complete len:140 (-) comp8699_c0_seq1:141-560(-)